MLILITGGLVKSAGTGTPNTQKCRMKNFSCDKDKYLSLRWYYNPDGEQTAMIVDEMPVKNEE